MTKKISYRRQVVILCGGKGTRLTPLTHHCPKFLVPIAGRPFAYWRIKELADAGFKDFLFLISHRGEQIIDYVNSVVPRSRYKVTYSWDPAPDCGNKAALQNAYDGGFLKKKFIVVYGDSLLPTLDYSDLYERVPQFPTVGTLTDDGVEMGATVVLRDLLFPSKFWADSPDWPTVAKTYTIKPGGRFYEIGSHVGFYETENYLEAKAKEAT